LIGPDLKRRVEPLCAWLLALAAVGVALVSQHRFDMQPCPWCVLQRLLFVVGAAVAVLEQLALTAAHRGQPLARSWLLGICQGAAGLRLLVAVAGFAAALWQHFVAAAQASCQLTWADKLLAYTQLDALWPDLFQPRASCLEAKAWLLGLPYEFWSAALFVFLAVGAGASLKATAASKA
jgi:disulfide bond formation protein DsbB